MSKLGKSPPAQFADMLKQAKAEGWGYHDQMVRAAGLLCRLGISAEDAVEMMGKASEKVTRRQPGVGEIELAVGWVFQRSDLNHLPRVEHPSQVRINRAMIAEFAAKGDIKALVNRSGPIPETPAQILRDLYDEGDLLHLSPDTYRDEVKTCGEWLNGNLGSAQFICPAHLKDRERGRIADNVLRRDFVVFETDDLPGDWSGQAGLIERLAQELPLVQVVWSANKSLHGWFDARGVSKERLEKFHTLAVQLGGDRAVLRPAQLVRMPLGFREGDNRKLQKVIYYHA